MKPVCVVKSLSKAYASFILSDRICRRDEEDK